ncbi:UNVERIFIED_CONTAM: hypothetical protein Sindi_1321700 [Sesamum indicum]
MEETFQENMEPNESSSYCENREYFQTLEIQRREFLREILDKCDNGPKRIDPKLLTPEEKQEWLRNFEVRQVLPGNAVRRLHSTEVHGRIPARRNGTELEPDTSKISQDLREIQKTVQDYGHRLIHIPMKIESLSQKLDEILKILPDLHKGLTDLRIEITDLKKNQRESPETSRSRQERIRDALGTIYKIMEVTRADLSDLQELAESFSQLGIVDLVNIQTNELTPALPPLEGSTCSNDPPQDQPMRESVDFHTNATPTFVGTRLKENPGRNPKRVPENTPWARTMLQPLHPYGAILNLDIIDFRNIEKLIDEWVAAIKIAATTLELDKENFIKLVELSLEGSVKIGWDNTPEDTKASILAGDSKGAIADRLGRLIKIHFIGDGYFEGSRAEKAREYAQALFSLELRSICAVDEYIYWFRKYFFQSGVATEVAAPMFFAKICSPWREMLIQSYKVPEGQLDSVARRMSFLKDKLKDWCYQASIQKNMKRLRGAPEELFPDEDHGGPNPKPEHTNLDKERDQQGFHPKDLDEQMQDPPEEPLQEELSDEPIPEPMKVLKIAIAGLAEQKDIYLPIVRKNVVN